LPPDLTIRKATTNKSLRINWEDGKTIVAAAFLSKDSKKCQVVAQHMKLPDAKAAAKMKKLAQSGVDICNAHYFANERRSLCG